MAKTPAGRRDRRGSAPPPRTTASRRCIGQPQPVVPRMGDCVRTTVNSKPAHSPYKPGSTLIDAETKGLLEADVRYTLRSQRQAGAGFGVVRPFVLTRATPPSAPLRWWL